MKYLVVSDIHGSIDALQKVLEAYSYHQADAILCLGDVLYHGPRNDLPEGYAPKKVIEALNPYASKIIAVRGNCDAEVDQMVLKFPLLATYSELFLGSRKVFLTHGHVYSLENVPTLEKGSIFLSGHTHLPLAEERDGIYFLNPGSPSIPKGNHPASYGLLEEHSFKVLTFDHKVYKSIEF